MLTSQQEMEERKATLENDRLVRAGTRAHPNNPKISGDVPQVAPNWANQNELLGKEPPLGYSVDEMFPNLTISEFIASELNRIKRKFTP